MATGFSKVSKWLLVSGGALVVAGLIFAFAAATSGGDSVLAQASPTARPASPAAGAAAPAAASPVRTVVTVGTPVRVATATPGTVGSGGDSVTFPALAIALAGAGLVGLGLFSRLALRKSKA